MSLTNTQIIFFIIGIGMCLYLIGKPIWRQYTNRKLYQKHYEYTISRLNGGISPDELRKLAVASHVDYRAFPAIDGLYAAIYDWERRELGATEHSRKLNKEEK